ncbi:MAG: hypothetical protein D4R45_07780 [Planctomycetaceae bacterium]|nr:MAG: hypothetical protein D4R45_07780 [Planctomycetaceae bacterium]
MKKTKLLIFLSFLFCIIVFFGCTTAKNGLEPTDQVQVIATDAGTPVGVTDAGVQKVDVGYIEDVTFDRQKTKERITIYVSKLSDFNVERVSEKTLMIKIADMFVPEDFRKKLGEDSSKIINYVLPLQKTIDGKKLVYFEIALKDMVPYNVREEKKRIVIDFDVSALPHTFPTTVKKAFVAPKNSEKTIASSPVSAKEVPEKGKKEVKYTGQKITLDFQEANIKTVLRTLAELGNTNIVSGEDVKGDVTVHMKNIPWDQALDSIADIHGLVIKPMGNVTSVMTVEKVKKNEQARQAGEEARVKAEFLQKEAEKKRLIEKGNLRQVSIEARIVEAKTTFSQKLGVEWGGGYQRSNWGFLAGTNPLTTGVSGTSTLTQLPTGIGLTSEQLAVNFPVAVAAPTIGVALGGSKAILDAQLRALESEGDGKVISSPRVTTLDGVEATIEQGKEVPIVTPAAGDSPASVEYKKALLKLTVTPKITPAGRISMKIVAENKDLNWTDKVGDNPAINTSGVNSTIVVKDKDTIVVGGIYKLSDTTTITGVPGLSKIPILGWLFKSEVKSKETREILIFITPRIVPDAAKESKL